jgi:hypothetical protein
MPRAYATYNPGASRAKKEPKMSDPATPGYIVLELTKLAIIIAAFAAFVAVLP